MRWPKTEWGIHVLTFKERYGLTFNIIADSAGIKASVLHQVMTGKTPGYSIVNKVNSFIAHYEATHKPGPRRMPFEEVTQ
jgi:predicted transcriptional regulator